MTTIKPGPAVKGETAKQLWAAAVAQISGWRSTFN
jgi:hypothetical protein